MWILGSIVPGLPERHRLMGNDDNAPYCQSQDFKSYGAQKSLPCSILVKVIGKIISKHIVPSAYRWECNFILLTGPCHMNLCYRGILLQQLYKLCIPSVHFKQPVLVVGLPCWEDGSFLSFSGFAMAGQQQRSKALLDPNQPLSFYPMTGVNLQRTSSSFWKCRVLLHAAARYPIVYFCFLTNVQVLAIKQLHRLKVLCFSGKNCWEKKSQFLTSRWKAGLDVAFINLNFEHLWHLKWEKHWLLKLILDLLRCIFSIRFRLSLP